MKHMHTENQFSFVGKQNLGFCPMSQWEPWHLCSRAHVLCKPAHGVTRVGPPCVACGCFPMPGRKEAPSILLLSPAVYGTDVKICDFGHSSEENKNSKWVRDTATHKEK